MEEAREITELFADRYELRERIGVGGMSTVQLAFDTRLERLVAVKILAEHLAHDNAFVSRFRREALSAARLIHPNIVNVFDFGIEDTTGRQYIVMEHVDGQSCAEILRRRPRLPHDEAVNILAQACRGLSYAHRNGVIHRDVKPGNLLVAKDGTIKLADFGIAKAAEQSGITKAGSVLGTAAYLAPEQTRGSGANPASDQYALGIVAYQMLVGRLPYGATSLTELVKQQEQAAPIPPHDFDSIIPRQLSTVVMRALRANASSRFSNMDEFESALRESVTASAATRNDNPESTQIIKRGKRSESRRSERRQETQVSRSRQRSSNRQLEPLADEELSDLREARATKSKARTEASPRSNRHKSDSQQKRQKAKRPKRGRLALLFLLLCAIAGGAVAFLSFDNGGGSDQVQLRTNVSGDTPQSIEQLKALIEDNTAN